MKRLSPVLGALDDGSVSFFCAACGHSHNLPVRGQYTGTHDAWSWDGNVEAPVFTPSVRAWYPRRGDNGKPRDNYVCHSFVGCNGAKPGQIIYLADCTHALAGKVVDLAPFPPSYFDDYVPEDATDD
jgi:hypothetical protein